MLPPRRHLLALTVSIFLCSTLSFAQSAPSRVIVGYWHNWNYPNALRLVDIPDEFNVVNVAFAIPTTPAGSTMQFSPSPSVYGSSAEFLSDVQILQSEGKKVLISVGGGADPVQLNNATDVSNFVTSMLSILTAYGFDGMDIDLEGSSLSLIAGDTDFRNPISPLIVNLIDAVEQILAQVPADFILTAAPETAFVQGGYGTYAGVWGAYIPVLHALRHDLDFVHVQHYNSGTMYGRDGSIYTPGTADFHVAMAESLLAGFIVDFWGSHLFFDPLREDQVAIGLPASTSAAGNGYTPPSTVHQALDYLYFGDGFGGSYTLANAAGYPYFRGLMTWSANWDVWNGDEFSREHGAYLANLFLNIDVHSLSASTGGAAQLSLRAGRLNALRNYALLATTSGTSPGTALPGNLATLPLNRDRLFDLVASQSQPAIFQQFFGQLNNTGEATATLQMPPVPGHLAGTTVHFAYALSGPWNFASTTVELQILP